MKQTRVRASDSSNGTSTSVARAFAILDVLAPAGQTGSSLTEVATRLRMSKSTAYRYLVTLEQIGTVERDDKDRFRLGLKVIELAGRLLSNMDLRNSSAAILGELAAQTEETIHLGVPSHTEVVYIAKVDSSYSIQMRSSIGARVPMYCTALGKSILAHSPASLLEQVVSQGMPARTAHTLTSREALCAVLERVRAQGFAIDDEENEAGVRCVGAPIFNYERHVVGAISISSPATRVDRERCVELAPLVRDASRRISQRMGYSG